MARCGKCSITRFIGDCLPDMLDDDDEDSYDGDDNYNDDDYNVNDDDDDDDDVMIFCQVRQMFNNPVHRRLLARLLKVELEVRIFNGRNRTRTCDPLRVKQVL